MFGKKSIRHSRLAFFLISCGCLIFEKRKGKKKGDNSFFFGKKFEMIFEFYGFIFLACTAACSKNSISREMEEIILVKTDVIERRSGCTCNYYQVLIIYLKIIIEKI